MGSWMRVAKGMFVQERQNGRVVMGYLLGLAIMGYWMSGFLHYAADTGEPVNILETFCVVEQHYMNLLFLVLGWMFVVADAPFVKGNTYLLLYRCGRRSWNRGMLFYLLSQAFFYTAAMAAFTVAVSGFAGFAGDIWSTPVYNLAMGYGHADDADFPWVMMMKTMTVPQAFAVCFLFMYLYLAFLGMLLYVCNLFLSGIAGMVIVMGVHLIGYLQKMDGKMESSLLARAVPGYFIDGSGRFWWSAVLFSGLIAALAGISATLVKRVDFKAGAEVDG